MQEIEPTPAPWVLDDGIIQIEDQAEQLIQNKGTNHEWVALGTEDEDGFVAVTALAHPSNAEFIRKRVNAHEELVDTLEKSLGWLRRIRNEDENLVIDHSEDGFNLCDAEGLLEKLRSKPKE